MSSRVVPPIRLAAAVGIAVVATTSAAGLPPAQTFVHKRIDGLEIRADVHSLRR